MQLGEVASLGHSADPDRRPVAEDVLGSSPRATPSRCCARRLPRRVRSAWRSIGSLGVTFGTIAGVRGDCQAVKDATARTAREREMKNLIVTS